MKHSSGITPDQLRELHLTLLKATLQSEKLLEGLDEDSLVYQTLFRLSDNIESVIYNALYDANDLLFDTSSPYEPIDVDTEIKL
jgi:hypothetical protein